MSHCTILFSRSDPTVMTYLQVLPVAWVSEPGILALPVGWESGHGTQDSLAPWARGSAHGTLGSPVVWARGLRKTSRSQQTSTQVLFKHEVSMVYIV